MAHCYSCNNEKPTDQYYRRNGVLRYPCKACLSAYNHSQYKKHNEKRVAYDRARGNGWSRSGREKWNISEPQKHDAYLRRMYGIGLDAYYEMLEKQNGVCAICFEECNRSTSRRFCVDHNHETGVVRGLLCFQCNVGLGKFKENPTLLKSAIRYIGESK